MVVSVTSQVVLRPVVLVLVTQTVSVPHPDSPTRVGTTVLPVEVPLPSRPTDGDEPVSSSPNPEVGHPGRDTISVSLGPARFRRAPGRTSGGHRVWSVRPPSAVPRVVDVGERYRHAEAHPYTDSD